MSKSLGIYQFDLLVNDENSQLLVLAMSSSYRLRTAPKASHQAMSTRWASVPGSGTAEVGC